MYSSLLVPVSTHRDMAKKDGQPYVGQVDLHFCCLKIKQFSFHFFVTLVPFKRIQEQS